MKKSYKSTLIAALLLAVSCSKSSTDPDKSLPTLSITAKAVIPAAQTNKTVHLIHDGKGVVFTVDSARLYINAIRVKLPTGTDSASIRAENSSNLQLKFDSSGLIIQGPFTFNLLTGSVTPQIVPIKVAAGLYDSLEFRFITENDSGPWENYSNPRTIIVNGTFPLSDDTAQSFALELSFQQAAYFINTTALKVGAQGDHLISLNLLMNTWFSDPDIVECVELGGRTTRRDNTLIFDDYANDGPCDGMDEQIKGRILTNFTLQVD